MSLRYNFLRDVSPETLKTLELCQMNSRNSFKNLYIGMEAISPKGGKWIHAVETLRDYNSLGEPVIIIRVIAESHRGLNVTIPCTSDAMIAKYLDLRYLIRNTDRVLVSFFGLCVTGSPRPREIFLKAGDFKVFDEFASVNIADIEL